MSNYTEQLAAKYNKWLYLYSKSPWLLALKMGYWNLLRVPSLAMQELFKKQGRKTKHNSSILAQASSNWWSIFSSDMSEKVTYGKTKRIPPLPPNGHIVFDLSKALNLFPEIKRFGLVFFMGMGDYFYATNFIRLLHHTYPHIQLDAYVSDHWDQNNSPLVQLCIKKNPLFKHIYTYHGKPNLQNWKNYHWEECYNIASQDTLLLPVIYEYGTKIISRTEALCQTFSLPKPFINPLPCIDLEPPSSKAQDAFMKCKNGQKIVFLQMTSRSSGCSYPYTEDLIYKLLKDGFSVITVEDIAVEDPHLLKLNTKNFEITDTISLLYLIKQAQIPLYVITVFSVLNSISAGLKIPVLTLQMFIDPAISSVYYSNMWVVTHHTYSCIALDRQFIASQTDYDMNGKIIFYNVNFVKKSFDEMLNQL